MAQAAFEVDDAFAAWYGGSDVAPSPVATLRRVVEVWRAQVGDDVVWELVVASGSVAFASDFTHDAGDSAAALIDGWMSHTTLRVAEWCRDALLLGSLFRIASAAPVFACACASGARGFRATLAQNAVGPMQGVLVAALRIMPQESLMRALPPPLLLLPWSAEGGLFGAQVRAGTDDEGESRATIAGVCFTDADGATVRSSGPLQPALLVSAVAEETSSRAQQPEAEEAALMLREQRGLRIAEVARLFHATPADGRGPATRAAAQQRRVIEQFRTVAQEAARRKAVGTDGHDPASSLEAAAGRTSVTVRAADVFKPLSIAGSAPPSTSLPAESLAQPQPSAVQVIQQTLLFARRLAPPLKSTSADVGARWAKAASVAATALLAAQSLPNSGASGHSEVLVCAAALCIDASRRSADTALVQANTVAAEAWWIRARAAAAITVRAVPGVGAVLGRGLEGPRSENPAVRAEAGRPQTTQAPRQPLTESAEAAKSRGTPANPKRMTAVAAPSSGPARPCVGPRSEQDVAAGWTGADKERAAPSVPAALLHLWETLDAANREVISVVQS
jgi:hypothetical protein